MEVEEIPVDLTCPISLDLLVDPVSTPCCGKTFSRDSLKLHMVNQSTCPLCINRIKKNFPTFDVETCPPNRSMVAMIEHYLATKKAKEEGSENLPARLVLDDDPVWNCNVSAVQDFHGQELPVSSAQLNVNWPTYEGDVCMFIPVIDKSGSMAGRPFDQVKQALLHMHYLTFVNRHVFTCLIVYDSKAEKIMVPRDGDLSTARAQAVEQRIKTMTAGGGTDFTNAFKMIQEVLLGIKDKNGNWTQGAPITVTNAVVVFMTDGQDSTYHNKAGGSDTLVNIFQQNLKDWKKPLTVHTVGFSRDHDFNFLDRLRKSGSVEGVFRYAEPNDPEDSLCQKMSGLANSVVSNVALQANLYTPFPLRGGSKPSEIVVNPKPSYFAKSNNNNNNANNSNNKLYKTELRFDMDDGHGKLSLFLDTKASEMNDCSYIIEIGRRDFEIQMNVNKHEGDNNDNGEKELIRSGEINDKEKQFKLWIAYISKEILHETMFLAEVKEKKSEFYLKCSLLLKQARVIALHVRQDEGLTKQLTMCCTQLESLLRGKAAFSVARLSEAQSQVNVVSPSQPSVQVQPTVSKFISSKSFVGGNSINLRQASGNVPISINYRKGNDLHRSVVVHKVFEVKLLVQEKPSLCLGLDEDTGSTPLHFACFTGRLNIIEILYQGNEAALNLPNKQGLTPLDMAALCGKWKTVEILLSHGAQSGREKDALLKSVIEFKYYNTAARLVSNNIGTISIDVLQQDLPQSTLEWIMEKKAEKEVMSKFESSSPSTTSTTSTIQINNSNNNNPIESTTTTEELSIFLKNAVQHGMVNLVKKLLTNAKSSDLTLELLYLCGPNGNNGADIAELLLQKGLNPNKNDLSVTEFKDEDSFEPPLFRAAEKGWDQLLIVLLDNGADINWRNKKGNTALWIASANRHLECIVELLNAGANPDDSNDRGDSPLMCACQKNMCSGVATLLAKGAKVYNFDPTVNNPILVCCRVGHDVILETLLSNLIKDKDGEELVKKQLELFATIDGFNPLIASAEQNRSECIKILHKYKADLEIQTSPDNKIIPLATALHVAVYYGCVDAAVTLLELGANPNSKDKLGRTPLHIAVVQSNGFMVRLLKSYKADLSLRDNSGNVASVYASNDDIKFELDDPLMKHLLKIAQSGTVSDSEKDILRKYSSMPGVLSSSECVNITTGTGWTALMESVVFSNNALSSLLIELGANPKQLDTNEKGLSAVFWAYLLGRKQNSFFGIEEKQDYEMNNEELAVFNLFEEMKKLDVRNSLLFELSLPGLYEETQLLNNTNNNNNNNDGSNFLNNTMGERKENVSLVVPVVDIPKTRSKCSVVSFIYSILKDMKTKTNNCPNLLILSGLKTITKYISTAVNSGDHIKELGLQELLMLNMLSSSDYFFSTICSSMAESSPNLAAFSLAHKSLTLLPPYQGEIYRGINTKFSADNFLVGKELVWPTMTMCTSNWFELLSSRTDPDSASFKYNIIFIIKPTQQWSRSLAPYSSSPNLCPVMLLPYFKCTVKSINIASVIGLGQPEIRDTAYKMNDSYLKRAEAKNEPVFVVIE